MRLKKQKETQKICLPYTCSVALLSIKHTQNGPLSRSDKKLISWLSVQIYVVASSSCNSQSDFFRMLLVLSSNQNNALQFDTPSEAACMHEASSTDDQGGESEDASQGSAHTGWQWSGLATAELFSPPLS